jgi:nitronate monooxygenase
MIRVLARTPRRGTTMCGWWTPSRWNARGARSGIPSSIGGETRKPTAADPDDVRRAYREAIARHEIPAEPVWASQAIGLIGDLPPAAELVGLLAAQAQEALGRALAG